MKVERTEYGYRITGSGESLVLFRSNMADAGKKAIIAFNAILRTNGVEIRMPVKKLTESGKLFVGSYSNGSHVVLDQYDKERGVSYPRVTVNRTVSEWLVSALEKVAEAENA